MTFTLALVIPDEDENFDHESEPEIYFLLQDTTYETYLTETERCVYRNKLSKEDLKIKTFEMSDDDCESAKAVEKNFLELSNKMFSELNKLVDVKGANPNIFIMLLNFLFIVGAVAVAIFVKGDNKKIGRIATIALFTVTLLMIILLSYTILIRLFFVISFLLAVGFVIVIEKYSKPDETPDSNSGVVETTTEKSIPEVVVEESVSMASPIATTTETVKESVKNVGDGVDSEKLVNDVKDVSAKAVEKSKGAEGGGKLKGLKIGKKAIIAIVVVVLLTSVITYIVLAPRTIEFDPFLKNTDFEISGSEGYGDIDVPYSVPSSTVCANLKAEFDYSKSYCEKLIERVDTKGTVKGAARVKDKDVEIIDALFMLLYEKEASYEIENGGELSNGDKVEIKFVYNERYAKNNNIKIVNGKYEYEMKGLETKLVDSDQLSDADYEDIKEEAFEIAVEEVEKLIDSDEFGYFEYTTPMFYGQYIKDGEVVTVFISASISSSYYTEEDVNAGVIQFVEEETYTFTTEEYMYLYTYVNSTVEFEDGKVQDIDTEFDENLPSETQYENIELMLKDNGTKNYEIVEDVELKVFSSEDDISDKDYAALNEFVLYEIEQNRNDVDDDEPRVYTNIKLAYSLIVRDSKNDKEGSLLLIYSYEYDNRVVYDYTEFYGIFFNEDGNIVRAVVGGGAIRYDLQGKEQIITEYLDEGQVYEEIK